MTSEIKKKSFSLSTKLLHWLIAGHMSGLIVSGWLIVDLPFIPAGIILLQLCTSLLELWFFLWVYSS